MSKLAFGCVGNTIRLRSGTYFDLADPKPDQFTLRDISGALSKICRFGGQIDRFYSVAEHCYWCCVLANRDGLPPETRLAVLLHDAAEAFCGDVVKPLKIMLPDYAIVEQRIEAVIAEKFNVNFHRNVAIVREIDNAMLIHERNILFSQRDGVQWTGESGVRKVPLSYVSAWQPITAEARFLEQAAALGVEGIAP